MWSGGRSLRTIAVAGGLSAALGTAPGQTPLCDGQHPGNPELLSGAASCVYNEVGGIAQTVINLDATSVIRWNHLGLRNPGSSLSFEWSGDPGANPTVLNRVVSGNAGKGNTDLHEIAGTLQFQDGNLIVINPNSMPVIRGTVAARSLIFTTHQLDPAMEQALLNGQAVDFIGARRDLEVSDGRIVTTGGDLVLAGKNVYNRSNLLPEPEAPELVAGNGSVRIFGGENFRLLPNGRERIVALPGSGSGSVSSTKGIRAAQDVEISAGTAIDNFAVIDANRGLGRVYLRISDNGEAINNEATGFIDGFIFSSRPVTNSGVIHDDDTDSPSALSTGMSRFRIPPPPGGDNTGHKTVVRFENAPTAGSASAQRDRTSTSASVARAKANASSRVASNNSKSNAPIARGRSFFTLRGGAGEKKSR